jgi:hypothetical protein
MVGSGTVGVGVLGIGVLGAAIGSVGAAMIGPGVVGAGWAAPAPATGITGVPGSTGLDCCGFVPLCAGSTLPQAASANSAQTEGTRDRILDLASASTRPARPSLSLPPKGVKHVV